MSDPTLFDGALKPQYPTRKTFDHWSDFFNDHAPIKAQLDSPESVDAAVENMPNRASQRERVYDFLLEFGGATDEQIQDALALPGSTERPRRLELFEANRIKRVGTARTRSGRSAAVWGVA